jgi:hypothetical protein
MRLDHGPLRVGQIGLVTQRLAVLLLSGGRGAHGGSRLVSATFLESQRHRPLNPFPNGLSGYKRTAKQEQSIYALGFRCRLALPPELRRALACTNAIENALGTARTVSRNVKRWRNAEMTLRWTAAGTLEAQKTFRRLKAYRQLPLLRKALEEPMQNAKAKSPSTPAKRPHSLIIQRCLHRPFQQR